MTEGVSWARQLFTTKGYDMKTLLAYCTLAALYNTAFNSIPLLAAEPEKTAPTTVTIAQICPCFEAEVHGNGPAIILIPGLASSGNVWQSTVDVLQPYYQLHVLTLAGFAGKPALPHAVWQQGYLATQQQAILEYINQQQLQRPVIIGHSLGGYLALALATTSPDKISAAINVDGLPAMGALFSAAGNHDTAAASNNFDPVAIASSMTTDPLWQQQIIKDMTASDGMTSGMVMAELMQADLRPQLAHLQVPVLTVGALLNGAPYSTPEQVQANYQGQFQHVPAAFHQLAFASHSRHFIMADAPDWLNQQIQDFLQQHHQQ